MKRLTTILLASMLLVFCLTACGRKDNQEQNVGNPSTNQTTNTQQDGMNDRPETDVVPDNETLPNANTSDAEPGVSYEQMLRNGRIHDRDGLLKDGENATSDLIGKAENAVGDLVHGAKNAVDDILR